METDAYTPNNIGNVKFRIPLYQRPYAWEKTQIKQLLEDLYAAYKKGNDEPYYIGILSVGKTESTNLYDLIDGQQRITTLTLIGCVLKEYHDGWDNFLGRLDLYGRKEDHEYLKTLNKSTKPNIKMIEAIETITTFIKEKIEKKDFDAKAFSSFVYEHAAFFLSEVPDGYTIIEKNQQFVRMNNRGKQLESADILKVKLASIIKDEVEQTKFIKQWNNISQLGCNLTNENTDNDENNISKPKSLISICNEKEIGKTQPKELEIFYQSIVTFHEFLLIALDRFPQKPNGIKISYEKNKLLETFGFGSNDILWNEGNVTSFGEFIKNQYNMFIRFFIHRDKDDQKYTLFSKVDDEQFENDSESLADLRKKILMFQSYLYVSRFPQNWMKEAFDWIASLENNKDNKIKANEFLTKLKEIDNNSHKLPIKENSDKVNETMLTYGTIDRYWFWRLDYYLWEDRKQQFDKKSLKIADNYVFKANRSIEHIAPQTPLQNSSIKWNDAENSNEIMNTFGNLAMISSGQNSSLQNASFEMKKANVESFIAGSKTGSIESLKMLKIYQNTNWNKASIEEHGDAMIEILKNSYQDKN